MKGIGSPGEAALIAALHREKNRMHRRFYKDRAINLKPYLVITCVTWWVAAYSEEHARAIALVSEMEQAGWDEEVHDDAVDAEVVELTPERMREQVFHDGDSERPMIEEFERTVIPGIVACSEY